MASKTDSFPRRICMDEWTPAELAIHEAVQAVEEAGADVRLTRAVILLQRARESVADYVDGAPRDEGGAPPEEDMLSTDTRAALAEQLTRMAREGEFAFEHGEHAVLTHYRIDVLLAAARALRLAAESEDALAAPPLSAAGKCPSCGSDDTSRNTWRNASGEPIATTVCRSCGNRFDTARPVAGSAELREAPTLEEVDAIGTMLRFWYAESDGENESPRYVVTVREFVARQRAQAHR